MTFYFVDVGQGSCNVLCWGHQKAAIIDCGPRAHEVLRILSHARIKVITHLILTHNDVDHSRGAISVLTAYRGAIERVCIVHDKRLLDTQFWSRLAELLKKGDLDFTQVERLERHGFPRTLYSNRASDTKLDIYAPHFVGNLIAQEQKDSNATSGVLVVKVGQRRLVYSGDSTINQWRAINKARGETGLACDILTVPHHGGIGGIQKDDLEWLYGSCLNALFAIISVGSHNGYGHPRSDIITEIRKRGGTVLCTELTNQCCTPLEGSVRPDSDRQPPGRACLTRRLGVASRNVGCAGTVCAEIGIEKIVISRLEEHQLFVDDLEVKSSNRTQPLCRISAI